MSVSAECDGVLPDPDYLHEGVQGLVGLLVRLGEPDMNNQTASTTSRASIHWISTPMRGQDATLERPRVGRQLEEALTHGPDPLHLAEASGSTRRLRCATRTPHGPCWSRQLISTFDEIWSTWKHREGTMDE